MKNKILDDLKKINKKIQVKDIKPAILLRYVINFVEKYKEDPFKKVQCDILQEEQVGLMPVNEAKNILVNQLNYTFEELCRYCIENNIVMIYKREDFYQYDVEIDLAESINTDFMHPLSEKYLALIDLFKKLFNYGREHLNFILQHYELIKNENNNSLYRIKVDQQYQQWYNAHTDFYKKYNNTIYYAWNVIAPIYKAFYNQKQEIQQQLLQEDKINTAKHFANFEQAVSDELSQRESEFLHYLATNEIVQWACDELVNYTEQKLKEYKSLEKILPQKFWLEIRKVSKNSKLIDVVFACYGDEAKPIKQPKNLKKSNRVTWPLIIGQMFVNNLEAQINFQELKDKAEDIDYENNDFSRNVEWENLYKGVKSFNRAMKRLFPSLGDQDVLEFSNDNNGPNKKFWISKKYR